QPRPPPSNLHHRVPTFFDNDAVNAALAPFKVFGVVVQAQPKSQPRDHRRPACRDYHHRPLSCNSAFAPTLRVFALSSAQPHLARPSAFAKSPPPHRRSPPQVATAAVSSGVAIVIVSGNAVLTLPP
ncbi:hypothetical protein U1Q18_003205, partial [Sarracenia purpurea var. burkii]